MVHVINDYYIDSDERQYIMGKVGIAVNKQTGEERRFIKNPAYFSTLPAALMGISRQMRRDAVQGTDGELKELYEAIKQSDEALIKAVYAVFDDVVIREK